MLVGDPTGSTRVISIAAYQAAYEQYDYPFASAIAMIMGVVELLVSGSCCCGAAGSTPVRQEARADDHRQRTRPRGRRRDRPSDPDRGQSGRVARLGSRPHLLVFLVGIVGSVLVNSFGTRWFDTWLPEGLTTAVVRRGVDRLRAAPGHRRHPARSPPRSCVLSVLVGVPASYVLARRNFPGKRVVYLAVPAADPDAADHLRHPAGDGALQVRAGREHLRGHPRQPGPVACRS